MWGWSERKGKHLSSMRLWYSESISASAVHFPTITAVMMGRRKCVSSVISIITTASEKVRRVRPPKKAAAPMSANPPGSTQDQASLLRMPTMSVTPTPAMRPMTAVCVFFFGGGIGSVCSLGWVLWTGRLLA